MNAWKTASGKLSPYLEMQQRIPCANCQFVEVKTNSGHAPSLLSIVLLSAVNILLYFISDFSLILIIGRFLEFSFLVIRIKHLCYTKNQT